MPKCKPVLYSIPEKDRKNLESCVDEVVVHQGEKCPNSSQLVIHKFLEHKFSRLKGFRIYENVRCGEIGIQRSTSQAYIQLEIRHSTT